MSKIKKYFLILIVLYFASFAFIQIYPLIHGEKYINEGRIDYYYKKYIHTYIGITHLNGIGGETVLTHSVSSRAYITKFEECIVGDIMEHFKKHEKRQLTTYNERYSAIELKSGKKLRDGPLKGTFAINLAALILFGIFYRHIWGRSFYAILSITAVMLIYAASEQFKDRYLSYARIKAEIYAKTSALLKLFVCTAISAAILNILTGIIFPNTLPAVCVEQPIYSNNNGTYGFVWCNALTACIFILLQIVFITKLYPKNIRLLLAYLLPTFVLCAIFYPTCFIKYFPKLCSAMEVSSFVPVYTKLFFFMLSLLPGIFLYYIFGNIHTKSTRKKIVYAVVFSFCTALLWCVNGISVMYLVRLG